VGLLLLDQARSRPSEGTPDYHNVYNVAPADAAPAVWASGRGQTSRSG
jgi:hypothetical protein